MVMQTVKKCITDSKLNETPARIPAYLSVLTESLKQQGVEFTFINSGVKNDGDISFYGQFSDGVKWGFLLSEVPD